MVTGPKGLMPLQPEMGTANCPTPSRQTVDQALNALSASSLNVETQIHVIREALSLPTFPDAARTNACTEVHSAIDAVVDRLEALTRRLDDQARSLLEVANAVGRING